MIKKLFKNNFLIIIILIIIFFIWIYFTKNNFKEYFQGSLIYVGNLSIKVTDDELINIFLAYGNVISARVFIDRTTKKSRKYGFVEMENKDEANKAIQFLHGKILYGKELTVTLNSRLKNRSRLGSGSGSSFGGGGGGGGGSRGGSYGGISRGRY